MRTITIDEASSNLPTVLDEVEAGAEIIISRGDKPVARITKIPEPRRRGPRPVGQTLYPPIHVPDEAIAPLTEEELKEWGL